MPDAALPVAWPAPLAGTVRLHRAYLDPLGRPFVGSVTITGGDRQETGASVVIPASVTVELVAGVLEAHLPPGTYRLDAALRTVDGARASDTTTTTLEADS